MSTTPHNQDELEMIIKRNSSTIYKIAFIRTGSLHDAEDIMQEVFLRFVKRKPIFESAEHEKAWFIKTTINRTKSLFGTPWKKNIVLTEDIKISEQNDAIELLELILTLPNDISTAIHLHYYENMPIKDIAQIMNKSESAIKSLLFRGRKMLKFELTDTLKGE